MFFDLILFSSWEYAQFWVFGGTCVSLATSYFHSVSFCMALNSVSTEFSGNSKLGLYFCCKV